MEEQGRFFPTERATCPNCGNDFLATIINVGGEKIVTEFCTPCSREKTDSQAQQDHLVFASQEEDRVLARLTRLGVNLRVHGRLHLNDLGQSIGGPLKRWVDSVMQLGKLDAIDGVFLHGPVGSGKTQAMVSVVRAFLDRGMEPDDIVFDRSRALVTQLQDRYSTGQVDAFSRRRRACKVWLLDDAGTEKLTPDAMRVLEDIFDGREGHPTIVTSNLGRGEYTKRWSDLPGWERLASRLRRFQELSLTGGDRRVAR